MCDVYKNLKEIVRYDNPYKKNRIVVRRNRDCAHGGLVYCQK